MRKEEIEAEVLHNYPLFCKLLINLEKGLNAGLKWYLKNEPDLFKQRDFRPGTLGRYMSASLSVRFHFDRTVDYIKQENWDKDFIQTYTFELMKESGYLGHFKDIDQSIRFYLFHSFYHQLETTIRIIIDKLNLAEGKGKPLDKVNKIVGCFPEDFITCLDALRNTIHNNGYYRPQFKQPKEVHYKNAQSEIHFKENERTAMTTKDTISLICELAEFTECLLKHPEIRKIEITEDRN
ncbi:hypothetical protein GCM10009118_03260 [Wandonia haliotis]|uniref:Uncharacterized protein n=1 Tax=Wandonia haliotis TaxID=574963 RepID=A0ABN1ML58_9FLAO